MITFSNDGCIIVLALLTHQLLLASAVSIQSFLCLFHCLLGMCVALLQLGHLTT